MKLIPDERIGIVKVVKSCYLILLKAITQVWLIVNEIIGLIIFLLDANNHIT